MTITLKVSENTKQKMIEYFADKKRPKTPAYAVFQADEADTVVTLYESGKAVFQGVSADIDAAMWKEVEKNLNPGKKIEETNSEKKEKKEKKELSPEQERFEKKVYQSNSIGSDEVGTGDYFGPIVVTAAYVAKENIPFLEELGVKDSKKLNDEKILEIVPKLIKKIPYYSIVLSNEKYNLHRNEDINMNKMKAILHNQALAHLINEQTNIDYVVVDQFAKPYVYYNYLKDAGNVVRNITFMTKAEDKCLSVACASLISRFIFLKEFRKLEDKVDAFLPKGAGEKVDEVALRLVKKHGIEILNEIAKLNFKNTEKIKQQLN
ncbi:MAG TPA: ribonuclease HIII [Candidatus Fimihabitans intestinipullorum]|uniref:Ribonuclease HIII n=1 Tax=Candidatus Fimihabitans intestinipullorum TaxID=2840820 RepID=A0A9D1L2N0_9BACT|nr:ribonuclease HIII [Candidatus Fimihabitans intestinipullorum]